MCLSCSDPNCKGCNVFVGSAHPSKREVLIRAVSEILGPVVKELRALGYQAELIAEAQEGVKLRLEVTIEERA